MAGAHGEVVTREAVVVLVAVMEKTHLVRVVLVHQDKATVEVLLLLDKQGEVEAVLLERVSQPLHLIGLVAMVAHQKCLILITAQGHLLVAEVVLLTSRMVRRGLALMAVAVEVATLQVMSVMVL